MSGEIRRERRRALLDWYAEHRRDLPWRHTADPWAILVSEVMLQQTQVARVERYWQAFLDRFPTPASLAESTPAVAITAWGDLGYQRRVLNLRKSAMMLAERGWPTNAEELRSLPGVGPYTAAAVACFSFGLPVVAVDVNHRRVLSRWLGRPLGFAEARSLAAHEISREHPADWNQAIMDLGATICSPRAPACAACPVSNSCSDPSVELVTTQQSPFDGSIRQARARIVRALASLDEAMPTDHLRVVAGDKFDDALASLIADLTVVVCEDGIELAK